jgi:hypothetical protein
MSQHLHSDPHKTLPEPTTLEAALAELARTRPVYLAARDAAAHTQVGDLYDHRRHTLVTLRDAVQLAESQLPEE